MKYQDFSIRLEPASGRSYAVSVQSPQGEGRGTFQFPPGGESWDEASALPVGKELFRALFRDEVASLFYTSLGSLQGPHQGLRIRLLFRPGDPGSAPLQELPWELLCRPETEDVLCLSRHTPVIRFLEAHRERRPAITRPRHLRVLVVMANPTDRPVLDLERERENLKKAWRAHDKQVEIVFLQPGRVDATRLALQTPFHILHFMGHGQFDAKSGEGGLFFEGSDGTSRFLPARSLTRLLLDSSRSLRLVVLNACHTAQTVGAHGPNPFAGVASSLVMAGLPAVVAMSGAVSDRAAVAFSRAFYGRLAAGESVEAAVTEGRIAIQGAEPRDCYWKVPCLFLRSPDGIFTPRSTIWARRALLWGSLAMLVALAWVLAAGWLRERRAAKAQRLANEGIGLLELGRREEARQALRSALEIDPRNAAVLGNLAIVEMQLGLDETALTHSRAAVEADPAQAVHHYNFGMLLVRKRRHEEALVSLRRAIELDPGYAQAYNELGNTYLDLDHPAEARKAFEAGLRCDRTMAKLYKNLARAALAQGRTDEAIHHLEKGLPLYSPADPAGKVEAAYWLATARAAAGRSKEVCEALRALEELDPLQLSPFGNEAAILARRHGCNP